MNTHGTQSKTEELLNCNEQMDNDIKDIRHHRFIEGHGHQEKEENLCS
jgi:hypothetical protein